MPHPAPPQRRVAIVAGLRTPFVRAGSLFAELTALDLGRFVVQELVLRSNVDPKAIDSCIFGQVIPGLTSASIAREVVLAAGLPRSIECHTETRACATSIQTLTSAAQAIALGQSELVLAGGTESMSDAPIFTSRPLAHALVQASKAKSFAERLRPFHKLRPKDLLPVPPAIAEFSTGMTMGDSAEKMAKENGIGRAQQDRIAFLSHQRAAAAWKAGFFDDHVLPVPIPPRYDLTARKDNLVREDSSLEALEKLKPVFDKKYGTVTAGNASPLTDGAAALLLTSEARAKDLGLKPLGYVRAYAYAATDPADQLLQGPAYAAPLALDRAGMKLSDIDLVDMHEAFASQVASNLQALASAEFAARMGRSAPVGEVREDQLNVWGGSISLGHPFAATGARMVMQTLRALAQRQQSTALLTVCAQGGLGAALVLERT